MSFTLARSRSRSAMARGRCRSQRFERSPTVRRIYLELLRASTSCNIAAIFSAALSGTCGGQCR
jgi:hypothetical protein